MENWLLLAVGIVFLVCMIAGFVKGFLRIGLSLLSTILRSEERRVGKECRSRWSPYH